MNTYRIVTRDAAGTVLSTGAVTARSLERAARAMRAALRADVIAACVELWLDTKRVSVIVKRRKRLVMTEDGPRFPIPAHE